jgi:hypothetical protein
MKIIQILKGKARFCIAAVVRFLKRDSMHPYLFKIRIKKLHFGFISKRYKPNRGMVLLGFHVCYGIKEL